MQIVSLADNLHEMLKPVFWEKVRKILVCCLLNLPRVEVIKFALFLQSITSGWNHDGDPAEMLMVNKQVELFKQRMTEDPQFLQKKVKQYWKVSMWSS